jgi:sulfide:quinone oxidoreductase
MFKVDKSSRKVFFKDNKTQEVIEQEYDFLHLVPPQTSPEFLLKSGIIAPSGFVDVDI